MNIRSSPLTGGRRRELTLIHAKKKAAPGLTFARRWPRLFLVRQLAQHAQRLQHGLIADFGAADVTVFAIMRDDAATA